jgi:hypothetical protein
MGLGIIRPIILSNREIFPTELKFSLYSAMREKTRSASPSVSGVGLKSFLLGTEDMEQGIM